MYFARAVDSKIDELTVLKRRVEKLEKAVEGLYDWCPAGSQEAR